MSTPPTWTAAASPCKSPEAAPAGASLCTVSILCCTDAPHLTPPSLFCPIRQRRRVLPARSFSPPPELIEPSAPRVTALPIPGGPDNGDPVQEHLHVVPNSLTLNIHDLSAYTSQAPHVVAPFFLVRRLRDYDPSTDTYLHHAALLALGPILLKRTAFPQPAMSTMTFAFHDPHNLSTLTPCLQNPPSITAPPSLHNPAFPANSWGLAPATFSPAQYGPPAGFHHGDETHGPAVQHALPVAGCLESGVWNLCSSAAPVHHITA